MFPLIVHNLSLKVKVVPVQLGLHSSSNHSQMKLSFHEHYLRNNFCCASQLSDDQSFEVVQIFKA
ncbi:CLUMA_CG020076, isoform A [Clunio marinus]|uniref:CLUMA_CG020076, isoform A n=1 Tax=Clunio marinus TaxID=568069 RepID=A0A1J1J5D2_9DIPT|nr:CLUMA_CG020076, isoform A [Clunio marinus]